MLIVFGAIRLACCLQSLMQFLDCPKFCWLLDWARKCACSACSTIESSPVMLCWHTACILEISSSTVPSVCSACKRGMLGLWDELLQWNCLSMLGCFELTKSWGLRLLLWLTSLALIYSTWNFEYCPHQAWCLDRSACVSTSTGNVSRNQLHMFWSN